MTLRVPMADTPGTWLHSVEDILVHLQQGCFMSIMGLTHPLLWSSLHPRVPMPTCQEL